MKVIACFLFVLVTQLVVAQKNIVLVIADDLGYDYCPFAPNHADTAHMPNIGALMQKGVYFTNAWATPYCSSTRACMLTGRYSFRNGVGTVIAGPGSGELDSSEISIASVLKKYSYQGYNTACIGKWHMNAQSPPGKLFWPNTKYDFDLYSGNFQGAIQNYYNWQKTKNGITTTETNYATSEVIDDAIAWVDSIPSAKPFFVWLAFNAPHSPFHLPPANLHTVPGLTGQQGHINQFPEKYFKAMTEAMDTEFGRFVQHLNQTGKADSTVFIFIGDNGNSKQVAQIADTSHVKGSLYEYGIHVPVLISGNNVINPYRYSDALISTTDLFATIAEIANIPFWKDSLPSSLITDAVSVLPIVTNQLVTVRDYIFSEMFTPIPLAADGKTIRNADYKLIRFDSGISEFYAISVDTMEQNNLLSATLSSIELTNYYYLCNQLSLLTGLSACDSTVGLQEPNIYSHEIVFDLHSQQLIINNASESTLQISDVAGRVVYYEKISNDLEPINLRQFVPGIYCVLLSGGKLKQLASRKIIIGNFK